MTGLLVFAACQECRRVFGFNPERTPGYGTLCRFCIVAANERRAAKGLPEWPVHPDSYERVAP